jgi:hypothetical protein
VFIIVKWLVFSIGTIRLKNRPPPQEQLTKGGVVNAVRLYLKNEKATFQAAFSHHQNHLHLP